jgi:glycosyltransferase involved in cell wall biosynthesis
LAPNVRWLGALPPAEINLWHAQAAIFVAPSRYEPFGLAALEASLAGCALVLGDIPTLRELWTGAALFVPPDDREQLTHVLGLLILPTTSCAPPSADWRGSAAPPSLPRG